MEKILPVRGWDVFFIDEQTGWVAGEMGGFLLSIGGGTGWEFQCAPMTDPGAVIHDMFFLDRDRGWAVGAGGVILHTISGGADSR